MVASVRASTALALATSSFVCLFAISCRSESVAPSIEFTTIPKADTGGPAALAPVAGRVKGARPNQRIVLADRECRDRERAHVMRALERSEGRVYGRGGAAELLGINPTTLASACGPSRSPLRRRADLTPLQKQRPCERARSRICRDHEISLC